MRIAVLSDVHGNVLALEAVMRDLRTMSPDVVVNLGDHLSGPLWAAATADLLMEQKSWVQIRGNHDRHLVEDAPDAMGQSDYAAILQLKPSHMTWLRSLPSEARLTEDVFLCHGAPASDLVYLIENISAGFPRVTSTEELRGRIGALSGAVLCGHSHVQRLVRVDVATIVVNPGSIGLQAYEDPKHRFPHVVEVGSPHARYLLLDQRGSSWEAVMRVLEYDWERAALLADKGERPDWAHALRTGYVPIQSRDRLGAVDTTG
jgi:predicted phosphodiesterase